MNICRYYNDPHDCKIFAVKDLDVQDFKKDEDMLLIFEKCIYPIIKDSTTTYKEYTIRGNNKRLILNFTNFHFKFTCMGELIIDNVQYNKVKGGKIIAYHPESNPELLCVVRKKLDDIQTFHLVNCGANDMCINVHLDKSELENVGTKKRLFEIWKGSKDPNSPLSILLKNTFFSLIDKCLRKEPDIEDIPDWGDEGSDELEVLDEDGNSIFR